VPLETSPVREPIAQTSDEGGRKVPALGLHLVLSARGLINGGSGGIVFLLRHSHLVSSSGRMSGRFLVGVLGAILLCYMALKPTEAYRLTGGRLEDLCAEVGIESGAPCTCYARDTWSI
jgi:hypothetical protein